MDKKILQKLKASDAVAGGVMKLANQSRGALTHAHPNAQAGDVAQVDALAVGVVDGRWFLGPINGRNEGLGSDPLRTATSIDDLGGQQRMSADRR